MSTKNTLKLFKTLKADSMYAGTSLLAVTLVHVSSLRPNNAVKKTVNEKQMTAKRKGLTKSLFWNAWLPGPRAMLSMTLSGRVSKAFIV